MPQDYNFADAAEFLEKAKKLFEAELYAAAIAQLQQAQNLVETPSSLGGEVQIWLANAYDAIGETKIAIAICQGLTTHSDLGIAKQADYLVTIFSAPELSKLENATSTLPNLTDLAGSQAPKSFAALGLSAENPNAAIAPAKDQPLINQVPKQNHLLIWLAILTFMCSLAIWLYRLTQIQ